MHTKLMVTTVKLQRCSVLSSGPLLLPARCKESSAGRAYSHACSQSIPQLLSACAASATQGCNYGRGYMNESQRRPASLPNYEVVIHRRCARAHRSPYCQSWHLAAQGGRRLCLQAPPSCLTCRCGVSSRAAQTPTSPSAQPFPHSSAAA
jgi:hypothetical protein